jgi:hypothetical protein
LAGIEILTFNIPLNGLHIFCASFLQVNGKAKLFSHRLGPMVQQPETRHHENDNDRIGKQPDGVDAPPSRHVSIVLVP